MADHYPPEALRFPADLTEHNDPLAVARIQSLAWAEDTFVALTADITAVQNMPPERQLPALRWLLRQYASAHDALLRSARPTRSGPERSLAIAKEILDAAVKGLDALGKGTR